MSKRIIDIIKKFSQYESINWAPDFECQECHKSGIGNSILTKPQLVGWCETDRGYMAILECPHCYSKFRDYAATVNYMDIDEFENGLRCWCIGESVSNSKELLDMIK